MFQNLLGLLSDTTEEVTEGGFDLIEFMTSTTGSIVIGALALILLGMIFVVSSNGKVKQYGVKALTYSSLAIAVGTVLSLLKVGLPQGGSATLFSMLAITLIGYFYGVRQGVLTGVVFGLIQLIIEPQIWYPVQAILDYPVAFGMLGLSGVFCNKENGLQKGYYLAIISRFIVHTISGVIFFAEYTPEEFSSPLLYSVVYNASYIGVEGLLTNILFLTPVVGVFAYLKKNATKTI